MPKQQAQQVKLAFDIPAYFIESNCGANCSDAVVYWIYEGYEYMLGLSAGTSENVISLANAAITNSIP